MPYHVCLSVTLFSTKVLITYQRHTCHRHILGFPAFKTQEKEISVLYTLSNLCFVIMLEIQVQWDQVHHEKIVTLVRELGNK